MKKKIYIKTESKEVEASFYNDININLFINDYVKITFLTIPNEIKELVYGYLNNFDIDKIKIINIKENDIFIKIDISKDEFLDRLDSKEIINTCEQIILNDKKTSNHQIIMPFNSSRSTLHNSILKKYTNFFKDTSVYKTRISFYINYNEINDIESFDTNIKNSIYKAIGKAKLHTKNDLFDCIALLNFRLDIEVLKIIILQKITFIVFTQKPSFSVLKYAQKFGITLIEYENNNFYILTHQTRIV
ncbi:formate dehydrogenase accessory sulfurtransferase FdhD [Helicobacter sp. MIT 14-3879]|uniref:formate dehydrogenase accessory sulfurtransferase FdhD n=1 Tax=Helicobacter sp. MIT 14-3879 TaxID=2040649 RepID=UPI000E1F9A60|nr:formate dehydrogenase accessory sulfurtransferase FdhD [Helicobacter sp. MIT 14-3879]RDU62463.1 hypothetical protein CQA44_07030 [Helicobacter sp. MIT 14-3879]